MKEFKVLMEFHIYESELSSETSEIEEYLKEYLDDKFDSVKSEGKFLTESYSLTLKAESEEDAEEIIFALEDKIWGFWLPDDLSQTIWANMNKLIDKHNLRLDIIYDDQRFNPEEKFEKTYANFHSHTVFIGHSPAYHNYFYKI